MMETRKKEKLAKLKDYAGLINAYLTDNKSVLDFQESYFEMFKQDEVEWMDEEFEVLNGLFTDLDVFYYDSALRDPDDMDESQLRNRAEIALRRIEKLLT